MMLGLIEFTSTGRWLCTTWMDGATINKRVANALNEAAGKIAFKSYAADINAQGGGNDSTKTALKRLQDK